MSKNNIVLTIINDGNGSECGMTYAERCAAAEYGLFEYRRAAQKVAAKYGGSRKDVFDAATEVQRYYQNHAKETALLRKREG